MLISRPLHQRILNFLFTNFLLFLKKFLLLFFCTCVCRGGGVGSLCGGGSGHTF